MSILTNGKTMPNLYSRTLHKVVHEDGARGFNTPECTRQYMRMASKFSTKQFAFFVSPIPLKQQGAVMFVTLILLLVLTVLAVSQIAMNSGQTHLAANVTDSANSFEKTEAALNIGINSILKGIYLPTDFQKRTAGLYQLDTSSAPLWTTINWSDPTAVISSFQGASGSQATYFIEQLPSVIQPGQSMATPTRIYRITARSIGASGNTAVILQTTTQTQD